MRRKPWVELASLCMLAAAVVLACYGSEDSDTRIAKASERLFSASSQETIVASLSEILDITLTLTTSSQHRDEIKHHVDIARELIQNKSLFHEKARQYLSFAYRMVSNGQKFQAPPELDEFVTPSEAQEKATKYCRKLIADARSHVREGEEIEAARLLLGLVLMIITPVQG
jgi:hypothetical protein